MKIVQSLKIDMVSRTRGSYQIKLDNDGYATDSFKATIQLSDADLERLQLDFDKLKPGGILKCTFESRERPFNHGVGPRRDGEMLIQSIVKIETFNAPIGYRDGENRIRASYRLELATPHEDRKWPVSYPFYDFEVALAPYEYEECRSLPATVVFGVSFQYYHVDPPKPLFRSEVAPMFVESVAN